MKEQTKRILEQIGLIPVLRAKSKAQACAVVEAMLAGGVSIVEVTMTVPGAVDLLRELRQEYGKQLLLGSGTARCCAANGCRFSGASRCRAPHRRR